MSSNIGLKLLMRFDGLAVFAFILLVLNFGCEQKGCTDPASLNYDADATLDDGSCDYDFKPNPVDSGALPQIFNRFNNFTSITLDGDFVVLRTRNVPNHRSPYFGTTHARYEAYNGENPEFTTSIETESGEVELALMEQNLTFRIPVAPMEAQSHEPTSGGPIGVSVNGLAYFNQFEPPNQLLGGVGLNTLDQYNGHPSLEGVYHYHMEPTFVTSVRGPESILGVLLDGFFVYGPQENGVRLTSADLDEYHGHFGVTADFPQGVYHYHITDDAPWINGNGFWGTPGTVTQ